VANLAANLAAEAVALVSAVDVEELKAHAAARARATATRRRVGHFHSKDDVKALGREFLGGVRVGGSQRCAGGRAGGRL